LRGIFELQRQIRGFQKSAETDDQRGLIHAIENPTDSQGH
jgi:hypothetical protein